MRRRTGLLAASAMVYLSACVVPAEPVEPPCTPTAWHTDADGDGFGSPFEPTWACEAPEGAVADATDCDDADPLQRPGAIWYFDEDGDGHGTPDTFLEGCVWPLGYVAVDTDCDDADPTRNPDRDWFEDTDGDGAGDPGAPVESCGDIEGAVVGDDDCDDSDPDLSPSALEICDGIDNDCDELIDDADPEVDRFTQVTLFADADGDGWGTEEIVGRGCPTSDLGSPQSGDCDDSNGYIYPTNIDYVGGVDANCDGEDAWHDASFVPNMWVGSRRNTQFGRNAVLGDTDGDGRAELIVSEPRYASGAGGVGVFSNPALSGVESVDIEAPFWYGEVRNDEAGFSVAIHPDLDDDGVPDIVVASVAHDGRRGRVYVVSADAPSGALVEQSSSIFDGVHASADAGRMLVPVSDAILVGVALDDADANNAGRVYRLGAEAMGGQASLADQPHLSAWGANNRLGYGMAAVGDTDGDGFAEIAIGAYNTSGNTGSIVLLPESEVGTTVVTVEDATRIWRGSATNQFVGRTVAAAGDVDGDGLDDLLIGSGVFDTTEADAGAMWVVLGSTETAFDQTVADAHWTVTGDTYREYFGRYLSGPGDIDGDGKDDVLVGAVGNSDKGTTTGAVYGFLSDRGSGRWTLGEDDPDFLMVGEASGDQVGRLMLPAGDVNADGFADVWIGGAGGASNYGALYLLTGGIRE